MQVIYKYSFAKRASRLVITAPADLCPLSVGIKDGTVCVWAQRAQDVERGELVQHAFRLRETGEPFQDDEASYVGTVQDGPFVWHIFHEADVS